MLICGRYGLSTTRTKTSPNFICLCSCGPFRFLMSWRRQPAALVPHLLPRPLRSWLASPPVFLHYRDAATGLCLLTSLVSVPVDRSVSSCFVVWRRQPASLIPHLLTRLRSCLASSLCFLHYRDAVPLARASPSSTYSLFERSSGTETGEAR